MCEKYNLPYLQVQMLDLYQDWLNGLKPRALTNWKDGEALDPTAYAQQQRGGHDQTDRLNRALAGAMLNRMNDQAKETLASTRKAAGEAAGGEGFDPAVLTEEELEELMARR